MNFASVIKPFLPAVLLFLFVFSKPASGQNITADDSLKMNKKMPKVVVTASRQPQTLEVTGRHIGLIPAKTIQSLPVHSLDEVLRYVSNVNVQSRGAFGAQSDFSIRGSTFSQVLVLIDGMRYNDPLTAHYNGDIPVAPNQIERIEVLHGPASALYGADAMGGVINIITKSFSKQKYSPHNDANIKLGYGQYNLKTGRAGFTHYGQNFRIGGGGKWIKTPGQPLGKDYNDRLNMGTASLSGSVQLADNWNLAARTAYDNRDYNARYFYTASPSDNATDHAQTLWNQLRLTNHGQNQTSTLKASFKHNIDTYTFNAKTPANHHVTNLLNLQLYQHRQLSGKWGVSYGVQTSNRFINSTDRGRHNNWHYAGFATAQWQPLAPLTLSGSLRLDHDDAYGTELMPQLSAAYQLKGWVFRVSGGRSIRAPSYTEQYISSELAGPIAAGRNIGDPYLQAERSWSGEAGFDFLQIPGVRLSVTGYLRKSSNLIDYMRTNSANIRNNSKLKPNAYYLYAQNFNDVTMGGVAFNFSVIKELGNGWMFRNKINYTFNHINNKENIASKYLANYAHHLINGMISLRKGPYELALTGLWKKQGSGFAKSIGAFKQGSYSVWNIKVAYRVYKNFTLGIEADNIFDHHYQDILGAQMPGRWVMGTVSWTLGR